MELREWAGSLESVLGSDLVRFLGQIYWATVAPVFAEPRLIPPLIISTIVVAMAYFFYLRSRGKVENSLWQFLFPRDVFLHSSAKLDYKFFIVNQILAAHLAFGKVAVALIGWLSVGSVTAGVLGAFFDQRTVGATPGIGVLVFYTLVYLLALDFGKWYAHYLTHKIPVLWEFHKVHHAEEVLTPISAFRAHPFDVVFDFFFRLLFTGIVAGVFSFFYPGGVQILTILGFNAVAVVISLWINHLQHSHIPLSYGRFNKILLGPVMHQVHHSCEREHWDKNFGFIFGLWDWMFGTLHNPREGEKLTLGLPEGKGKGQFTTLAELYFRPFQGVWRLLTSDRKPALSP